jgi:hypothetical protein
VSVGWPAQRRASVWGFLAVVALGVLAIGIVAAVGTQISNGGTETGAGAYVSEHPLAYWEWEGTALGTIPAAVPPAVSTTVGAPTRMPRGGATYVINPSEAGQTSVEWTFEETTAAPGRTELAITFVDGLTSAASSITVYLETGFRAPGTAVTYSFYWDAGTFAPAALDIETMSTTVQACTAIGTCP